MTSIVADKPQPVFLPKLVSTLQDYSFSRFLGDLTAGVIVGIVALPLAIAFGIGSGVTPERGLITAIIAGFLISALGGSRVQIGGPTGAFVVIVYGIVQRFGIDGLIVCTMIAGLLLAAMGLLRLGAIIKFIPYPLVVGFTIGIAVIIATSQIRDVFGLKTGPLPAEFLEKWRMYLHALPSIDPTAVALSAFALAILVAWPKISHRIPGSLVAILAGTAIAQIFSLPVGRSARASVRSR